MNSRLPLCFFPVILMLTIVIPGSTAVAQDNSHSNPAAKGAPVKSVVQIGSVNASNYDVTITLLETVRGKQALDRLQAASAQNKPPKAGFEYLLARVRFALKARNVSDKSAFDLATSPFQWVAFSQDFAQYEPVSLTAPKPELKGLVQPGETMEGWVAFEVEQKDSKPIMTFDPASGGSIGRGKILFFKLY